MKKPKLIDKWSSHLPAEGRTLIDALLGLAEGRGLPTFLTGGPVRDLLLERPSLDADLVVEGDAPALARQLAASLGARAVVHPAFGTATVEAGHFALDLVTARSETYQRPGALPGVRPASIREDLLRRDFTINAMALSLTGGTRGMLLDPCCGQADLQAGLIRVLRPDSFRDDATRILRAARYESRFGFRVEEQTLAWLRAGVDHIPAISGARLHHEISRIFHESAPERALLRLHEWGALAAIYPALSFDSARAGAFAELRHHGQAAVPAAYWPLLAWSIQESDIIALAHRLALTKGQAEAVASVPRVRWLENVLWLPSQLPSERAQSLAPYPAATLWALATIAGPAVVRERCLDYLLRLRHAGPLLRGHDLLALGVPEGPIVGEVMRRLRIAKLDGVVKTRKDEERFVLSLKPQVRTRGS